MPNPAMTAVSKPMLRPAVTNILLLLAFSLSVAAAPPLREAPNPTATPADQLSIAGNACGPAALLNAFRYGNADWQRASNALPGENDRQRLQYIIRGPGMRPSTHLKGRARWSRRGVNIADLQDIANELTQGQYLPQMTQQVLFRQPGETPEKLLRRVHKLFNTSLEKGLPPVISLRRHVLRTKDGASHWTVLDAHFVTLTSLPRKLDKNARSFAVTYVDPWGGKVRQGVIGIPDRPLLAATAADSPCLEAVFPDAAVGKKLVRKGESSALAAAAALGRW